MAQIRQCLLIAGCVLLPPLLAAQHFYPDDPLWRDPAPVNVSRARQRDINDYYDFFVNTFDAADKKEIRHHRPGPSEAINTLGEVPDSAWFTNRIGARPMSRDELLRGPGIDHPPAMGQPWVVISAKNTGITPGLVIRDSKGRRYFLKFDPKDNPDMATAADVIGTKFFYALGYNTPEDYIVHFRREKLALDAHSTSKDARGRKRSMTERDLTGILAKVPRAREGQYRGMASLTVPGELLGPFRYTGTRSDDPNDIVDHENRRDLRGLYVFCAWLNHTDAKSINSLDSLVDEGGLRFIRHYLIDFGDLMGSDSDEPKDPYRGHEYVFQAAPVLAQLGSFGFYEPGWMRAHYRDIPEIGNLDYRTFDPEHWHSNYQNPAFELRTPGDSYWAAKKVMAFSDDDIRAIVASGQYDDPRAVDWATQCLIQRRNRIGRAFFHDVLPLDDFVVRNGKLQFEDLAMKFGFEGARPYSIQWSVFDNRTGRKSSIAGASTFAIPRPPKPTWRPTSSPPIRAKPSRCICTTIGSSASLAPGSAAPGIALHGRLPYNLPMNVPLTPLRCLYRAVDLYSNSVGIVSGDVRFTYAQFGERCERLASGLQGAGVHAGDRVAYLSFNTHQLMEGYYGVPLAGGIVMPLNVRLTPAELTAILRHAEPRILIYEPDFAPLIECLRPACPAVEHWISTGSEYDAILSAGRAARPDLFSIDENAICELFYTSGSTGTPKGVALSHRTLYLHAMSVGSILFHDDTPVALHTIPLFHANGWGLPQCATMMGLKQVMVRRFEPAAVFRLIQDEKATMMLLVPTMANALVNSPEVAQYDLSGLQYIGLGGAASSPELIARLEQTFRCKVLAGYGLTETSPVATWARDKRTVTIGDDAEGWRRHSMTGWSIPGCEVRVVDLHMNDVPRDMQSIGEIVIRGDNVMDGYYKEPAATAAVMTDGWLHTGDMAVWDEDGYVLIVDRKKDIIISGGENISSIEVERAIAAHPGVLECAVVASPDPQWGEVPAAYVVAKPGTSLTEQDLCEFLKTRLARFKTPRRWEFSDAPLPKTGTGKIVKRQLREPLWSGKEKRVQG